MAENGVSVLVADDHKMMRDGLVSQFQDYDEFRVVGQAADGLAAIKMVRDINPDVVVMDMTMPKLNGIGAARKIKARNLPTRVVGLSMHADERFVAGVLEAGALAYVHKMDGFEELIKAVRKAMANQIYVSPTIAEVVMHDYVGRLQRPHGEADPELTPRKKEILQLLAEGHSTREISELLHLSVNTVETHRNHIKKKLGLSSVADLVKYALREGLTTLEH